VEWCARNLRRSAIAGGAEGNRAGFFDLVVATLFAFVVGYASIALLLRFLAHHSTAVFVAYRIGLGLLVLVLVSAGAIR